MNYIHWVCMHVLHSIADEKAEKKRRADEKKAKQKAEGTYKTKKQREAEARSKVSEHDNVSLCRSI